MTDRINNNQCTFIPVYNLQDGACEIPPETFYQPPDKICASDGSWCVPLLWKGLAAAGVLSTRNPDQANLLLLRAQDEEREGRFKEAAMLYKEAADILAGRGASHMAAASLRRVAVIHYSFLEPPNPQPPSVEALEDTEAAIWDYISSLSGLEDERSLQDLVQSLQTEKRLIERLIEANPRRATSHRRTLAETEEQLGHVLERFGELIRTNYPYDSLAMFASAGRAYHRAAIATDDDHLLLRAQRLVAAGRVLMNIGKPPPEAAGYLRQAVGIYLRTGTMPDIQIAHLRLDAIRAEAWNKDSCRGLADEAREVAEVFEAEAKSLTQQGSPERASVYLGHAAETRNMQGLALKEDDRLVEAFEAFDRAFNAATSANRSEAIDLAIEHAIEIANTLLKSGKDPKEAVRITRRIVEIDLQVAKVAGDRPGEAEEYERLAGNLRDSLERYATACEAAGDTEAAAASRTGAREWARRANPSAERPPDRPSLGGGVLADGVLRIDVPNRGDPAGSPSDPVARAGAMREVMAVARVQLALDRAGLVRNPRFRSLLDRLLGRDRDRSPASSHLWAIREPVQSRPRLGLWRRGK